MKHLTRALGPHTAVARALYRPVSQFLKDSTLFDVADIEGIKHHRHAPFGTSYGITNTVTLWFYLPNLEALEPEELFTLGTAEVNRLINDHIIPMGGLEHEHCWSAQYHVLGFDANVIVTLNQ
jgi:hypothetical protein